MPISARGPEVAYRAVHGQGEGDLLAGAGYTYLATPVRALTRQVRRLPTGLQRSLTWDRGIELADQRTVTIATGIQVAFCDPQRPWQRGTNEDTNGLRRQYFPKGMDLATMPQRTLNRVAGELNGRPRKVLGSTTPAEVFHQTVGLTA